MGTLCPFEKDFELKNHIMIFYCFIEELLPPFVFDNKTKWKQDATTVAGGNGRGDNLNQFSGCTSIYIDDDDQSIYITDSGNHRIVQWKFDAINGEVVAGGNGQGDRIDQLNEPLDAILDKKNNSLIICDFQNRRVVKWSRRNKQDQQILIYDSFCWGLAMDNNGNLYVADIRNNEVRRWKQGDKNGIIVAGGNEKGNLLSQLSGPRYIFVDQDYSVYVADVSNSRVMKWKIDETEGILVARAEVSVQQPNYPVFISAVIVDHMGDIYVSETGLCKITRWSPGALKGSAIVDGKECGTGNNHLYSPIGLSFDRQYNLYVVDAGNNRIQKFSVDLD
jgi:sugar lactone lactonase YvrE